MENINVQSNQLKTNANGETIYDKLNKIQCEIKAPKALYNKYGNFNYRNAEGILEALKPYLSKHRLILIMRDDIEERGIQQSKDGREVTPNCYIKATATLIDCETGDRVSTYAYAQECKHPNMTGDQCTGTASSYARKYCLNALLLLDDSIDSDTDAMKEIESGKYKNNGNQNGNPNYQQNNGGNNGYQNGGYQNNNPNYNRNPNYQQNNGGQFRN